MKKTRNYLVFLLISFFIHILFFILFYILFNNIDDTNIRDEKKVKLSFKRGGDVAKKDSTLKENTPLMNPKIVKQETPQKSTPISQMKQNSSEQKQNIAKDVKKETHSQKTTQLTYDLSNLEVFNPIDSKENSQVEQNSVSANISRKLQSLPKDTQNEIMQLYGDELGDYGEAEQDFIINNLRDIGRITQYHLSRRGYPPDAGYLGQQGTNAVEFYLYPNGDISDLKIIQDSKSMILDKNTLTIIQIAYKDYPRPTTKTKIKIYVKYYLQY